jgi:hypothetical protein
MKKLLIPVVLFTTSLGFFAFRSELSNQNQFHKSPLNGGGSPAARTGAPGEQNCTACHSGSTQAGTTENVFTVLDANNNPVSSYILGETYTVNLAMASNPSKKGFQSTVLSGTNAMAGNFTAGTTTQVNTSTVSGGQRKYANHKSTSNSSSTPLWSWTWTAPATNVGNVTFYVSSNKANGNNNDNGDVIYLSQHVITAPSTAGIEENTFNSFGDNENVRKIIKQTINDNGLGNKNIKEKNNFKIFNEITKNEFHEIIEKELIEFLREIVN